jgi:hypothetical protein
MTCYFILMEKTLSSVVFSTKYAETIQSGRTLTFDSPDFFFSKVVNFRIIVKIINWTFSTMAKSSIIFLVLLVSLVSGFIPRQPAIAPKKIAASTSELKAAPTMVVYWTIKVSLQMSQNWKIWENSFLKCAIDKQQHTYMRVIRFLVFCDCKIAASVSVWTMPCTARQHSDIHVLINIMVVRNRLCRLRGGTNRRV